MREIEYSTAFKKDYKRESRGKYREVLDTHIEYILSSLVEDQTLNTKQ